MTQKELSRLLYLQREILSIGEDMEFKDRLSPKDREKKRRLLQRKTARLERELEKLTRFIESADDPLMRMILKYRYLYGLSWTAVAMRVGGGNTAESVKKRAYRYLQKMGR